MNSIAKPETLSNDAFQGSLDRVFAKSKCSYRKPTASESRVAAEMLRQMHLGNIALQFQDPDTCEADWSEEAVRAVIGVVLREDWNLVVSEWLEEFTNLPYPMSEIIRQHPDYPAKCEAWEEEQAGYERRTGFKSEADEHRHFDDIDRASDMRRAS